MFCNILAFIFNFFVKLRNNWFDKHQNSLIKSDFPVISVGNLIVGGTGKTPFVISLCHIIKELGYNPCVIGRGYKRKKSKSFIFNSKSNSKKFKSNLNSKITVVSDGNQIFVDAKFGGDEMVLIAQKAKVPVIAGKSKSQTVASLTQIFHEYQISKIDCVIIDDGFQHRQLHRNLDIVLVDENSIKNPFLLPKGRLREPFSSLQRADIIVLTKNAKEKELQKLEKFPKLVNSQKLIINTNFKITNPIQLFKTQKNFSNSELFSNNSSKIHQNYSKVITVSGIANPQYFIQMLKNKQINVINSLNFKDHHSFSENDIAKICRICAEMNCFNVAITEKDAVKLLDFENIFVKNKISVLIFPLSLEISENKSKFIEILRNIFLFSNL